jgi:hypothetical protein
MNMLLNLQVVSVFLDADFVAGAMPPKELPSKDRKKLLSRLQRHADMGKIGAKASNFEGRKRSAFLTSSPPQAQVELCYLNGTFLPSPQSSKTSVADSPDDFTSNDSIAENKRLSWILPDKPKDPTLRPSKEPTLSRQPSIIDNRNGNLLERMRRSWASMSGSSLKADLSMAELLEKAPTSEPQRVIIMFLCLFLTIKQPDLTQRSEFPTPVGSSSALTDAPGGHSFVPEADGRVDSNEIICCDFCAENIEMNEQLKCKGARNTFSSLTSHFNRLRCSYTY